MGQNKPGYFSKKEFKILVPLRSINSLYDYFIMQRKKLEEYIGGN